MNYDELMSIVCRIIIPSEWRDFMLSDEKEGLIAPYEEAVKYINYCHELKELAEENNLQKFKAFLQNYSTWYNEERDEFLNLPKNKLESVLCAINMELATPIKEGNA